MISPGKSRRFSKWLLLATLVSLALFVLPRSTLSAVPRGVFSLSTAGNACKATVLSNPDVTGVAVRCAWSDIESTEGVFDWTFLDSEVARVAAAGKQVLLRIITQAGKPAWVTTAVTNAGGSFYTFDDNGVTTTIPVFWDPTFLAKKKAMIAALGARFASNPAVKIVSTSFANATSEDWNVPHTPDEVTKWLAVGYTSEKMLDAGKQIIDATMTAFPTQYVTMAIGGNGHVGATGNLDPDATYVARNAVLTARAAWPGRMIAQMNSLSTFNPPAPGPDGSVWNLLWNSRPDIAGQMLYQCFTDPDYRMNGGVPGDPATVLREAIDAGVSYGMNYIEIYQVDVVNLPATITYARTALSVPPPPLPPTGFKLMP